MSHKTRHQLTSHEKSRFSAFGSQSPVPDGGREYEHKKWVGHLQQFRTPGAAGRFLAELRENREYDAFSDELDKVAKRLGRGDEHLGPKESRRLASLAKSLKELIFIMKCADQRLLNSFLERIIGDAAFKEDTMGKLKSAVEGLKPGTRHEDDRFSWLSQAERSEFASLAESVLRAIE